MSMSNPPRTIRRDIRVFISAVTRELGSVRKLVKKGLEDNDYHAVEQDNFPPDYRNLKEKLRERINSCDAVVHIAGQCYGAEPKERPADAPRRSYTQLEYDMSVELGKPVYVFLTGADFPSDPREPEPPELQELQAAHRERLVSTGQDYNPTDSIEQLDQKIRSLQLKVERLTDEIQQVDQKMDVHGGRLRWWLIAIAAVVLAALGALIFVGWRQERDRIAAEAARKKADSSLTSVDTKLEDLRRQFADPDVLAGKIKSHIRKRAEEEIAAAKSKAPDDWRKRDEIEKRRDQALERVQDLVETIRKGLAGEPDPIFVEAAEILDKQGVDEAIKYLEQKQPSIDKSINAAKSLRDQAEERLREAYRPKVLQANLYEANLRWEESLRIREEVARENPRWFEARTDLGNLLRELARYSEAEVHLRAAVDFGANPREGARGLNNLARLLHETNRQAEAQPLYRRAIAVDEKSFGPGHPIVAIRLNNLAESLRATNRLTQAEPLYRRALAIDEKSYNPDHPNVARGLNNLAALLLATNRLAEAAPAIRQALAIDEKSYGPAHPDVAIRLNNLAEVLQATNRLGEAELLHRRALAVDEKSYGADHPNVATDINNLAELLRATNRLAEAEPLYRRALAVDEQAYGSNHPDVARDLNNLAALLPATNRLAEAEPLYRRALAIDEKSYGPNHPEVAMALNNLSSLLRETNRLSEAEPLCRRALAIYEKSYGPDHPDVAIDLNNLAGLLRATSRLSEAEPLYRRALAIYEKSYTPDHPDVATTLGNLVGLLADTNRLSKAEPLMVRVLCVLSRFKRSTGHEHPHLRTVVEYYGQVLTELKLAEAEIASRIKAASERMDELPPIVPEVERLLGPVKPVADVLRSLDRQYIAQGDPAIDFLRLDEPISARLDQLLRPSADGLNAEGVFAFRRRAHADAVVLYEAALDIVANQSAQAADKLRTRMNRAAALRELGLIRKARDELVRLLPELDRASALDSTTKGRARYHLALCQWRLGDRASAQRSAETSLAAYDSAPKANPVDPTVRRQSEDLLTALKAGKAPPPLPKIDAPAALEAARARYRAREVLAKLPLNQKAGPLLDQVLGPARPTQEVFNALDRSYREQKKPAVWFLPLNEPIAPHLDQILGPAKPVREVLESLDRQYRAQGKPAVCFLPLNEPIAPHLDELLGKGSR
jgi:tetratricopeptide (TPR) repeat protein